MKRSLLIGTFAVLAVATLALSGCSSKTPTEYTPALEPTVDAQYLVEDGYLTIGVDYNSAPFASKTDSGLVGLDISAGYALAEQMGLKATFIDVSTGTEEEAITSGKVDIVMSSSILDFGSSSVSVIGSYINEGPAIFSASSSEFDVATLTEKTIGVQANSISEINLKTLYPNASVTEYEAATDAFDALEAGEIEVVITDAVIGSYLSTIHEGIYYNCALQEEEMDGLGLAISSLSSELALAVQKALEVIENNGVLDAALVPWIGSYASSYVYDTDIDGDLLIIEGDGAEAEEDSTEAGEGDTAEDTAEESAEATQATEAQ